MVSPRKVSEANISVLKLEFSQKEEYADFFTY